MKCLPVILLLFFFNNNSFAQSLHPVSKNWLAIYIWDSYAPLTLEKTVPEMLSPIEVIFQQHATYSGTKKKSVKKYGERSTEGHFMVWIHLDSSFYEKHGIKRSLLPEKVYMFKDRETDIFTAWSGQANFRDFILDGVSGLCNQTVFENGTISGELDVFSNAVRMGNAEYGAGFYLSDEQALNAVQAIMEYPGFKKGYGFLANKVNRPEQSGFEHEAAQSVNGYNCNDFAFYLLEKAEVLTKKQTEDLKVEFWYPSKYWNNTIPLSGSGKRIFKKFDKNRSMYMGRDKLLGLAWSELFFSGLNIFDERSLIEEIYSKRPEFNKVRLWDQLTMINYLKNPANRDFKAKLVIEELFAAASKNLPIDKPYQESEQVYNYRISESYNNYKKGSEKRTRKKLKKAFKSTNFNQYSVLEKELKSKLKD